MCPYRWWAHTVEALHLNKATIVKHYLPSQAWLEKGVT